MLSQPKELTDYKKFIQYAKRT
jgi:hypothetical protein